MREAYSFSAAEASGVGGRQRYGWTLSALALAWLALTTPWWWQGLAIPFDSQTHFYPMLRGLARHLAAGDWPAWMPETFGGRPTLADPQSLVATPSFLALAWLDPTPSLRAMDMLVLGHLLIGGGAVAVWALRRGAHPLAALFAGLVFAFGGAAMGRLQHTLLVLSYAWLPVAVLAVEALLQRPGWRRAVVCGIALALLTINRDHVALMGHLVVAGAALAWTCGRREPWRQLGRALPPIGLARAVWLVLIALPLAASVAYVPMSVRGAFDVTHVGANLSLPWASLLTLPFPNLFATLSGPEAYWGPSSPVWFGFWFDYAIVQMATGVVPAVVLAWLGVLRGGLLAPLARLGAVIAACALVYAVGDRTPVFRLVFETVPGFDLYQRPADAAFLFNLGVAFALVGIVDRYLRVGLPPVGRSRVALEALVGLGLIGGALALAAHFDRLADSAPAVLVPTAIAAVVVALLVAGAAGGPRRRVVALVAVVAITLPDLAAHTAGTAINARPAAEAAPLEQPAADPLARWLGDRLAEAEARDGRMRAEVLGLGGAWQNAALPLGIDTTLGYNPLRNTRYDQATGAGQNSGRMERWFGKLMTGYAAPFADLLGMRYVVLGGPMEQVDPTSVAHFPPPLRIGDAYVYENPRAVPRLVLVAASAVRPHDADAILASGVLPAFDGRREALVEAVAPEQVPSDVPFAGDLRVVAHGPDRVRIVVTTDRAGWVVFHEVADPGWAAWVDGDRRPIHRANVLFQAVRVDAGTREVVFDYAPWRAAAALFSR